MTETATAGSVGEVEVLGRRYRFKVPASGEAALQDAAARLRAELAAIGADSARGDATELLVLAALRLSLPEADATHALEARLQALTAAIHASDPA